MTLTKDLLTRKAKVTLANSTLNCSTFKSIRDTHIKQFHKRSSLFRRANAGTN